MWKQSDKKASSYLLTSGRVLLALYFLLPGVMKFVAWDMHVQLMQKHQMLFIPLLLATAGLVQIAGSVLLLMNKIVWQVCVLFACLVLAINFNLHDFWNYSGVEGQHELQNFVKNLGILAGILILAGHARVKT